MGTDAEPNVQLEIGHVLFIDVVGYSKLLLDEQRELQQQLTRIVRNTEQVRTAEAVGKLIQLPASNGSLQIIIVNSVLAKNLGKDAAWKSRRSAKRCFSSAE